MPGNSASHPDPSCLTQSVALPNMGECVKAEDRKYPPPFKIKVSQTEGHCDYFGVFPDTDGMADAVQDLGHIPGF